MFVFYHFKNTSSNKCEVVPLGVRVCTLMCVKRYLSGSGFALASLTADSAYYTLIGCLYVYSGPLLAFGVCHLLSGYYMESFII